MTLTSHLIVVWCFGGARNWQHLHTCLPLLCWLVVTFLFSRSCRLLSSQHTAGLPGATNSCLLTPFHIPHVCWLVVALTSPPLVLSNPPACSPLPCHNCPLLMQQPLSASLNALHTLLVSSSCSLTCPSALPHLVRPSWLSPCLSPRRHLLCCIKTAQSTHSHQQRCKRVLQMVSGGQYPSPICNDGSGSLSGTHVWTICVNCHHCCALFTVFLAC